MIHKNKQDTFEYNLIKHEEVEVIMVSAFSRGNENWKVLHPIMTTGYEAKAVGPGESGKTKFRGQLQLYKVSNGVESKFAILDIMHINEKEFRIYVLTLENLRMDAQMRFERESKRVIERFEMMPEELKKKLYGLIRDGNPSL